MNSDQLELEKQKLVAAELSARLAEANAALAKQVAQNTAIRAQVEELAEEKAQEKAAAHIAQHEVLKQDAIDRAKPKTVARPASYTEYQVMSRSDKAKVIEYFGVGCIEELFLKHRRENPKR
jgi:hypothetical protein